jgi:hypothetical protein
VTTQPSDYPIRTDQTITITLPPPLRLVDRDGYMWQPTGRRTPSGEPLLECLPPADQEPDDFGEGESHPWTLTQVERWFSPLRTTQEVAA